MKVRDRPVLALILPFVVAAGAWAFVLGLSRAPTVSGWGVSVLIYGLTFGGLAVSFLVGFRRAKLSAPAPPGSSVARSAAPIIIEIKALPVSEALRRNRRLLQKAAANLFVYVVILVASLVAHIYVVAVGSGSAVAGLVVTGVGLWLALRRNARKESAWVSEDQLGFRNGGGREVVCARADIDRLDSVAWKSRATDVKRLVARDDQDNILMTIPASDFRAADITALINVVGMAEPSLAAITLDEARAAYPSLVPKALASSRPRDPRVIALLVVVIVALVVVLGVWLLQNPGHRLVPTGL